MADEQRSSNPQFDAAAWLREVAADAQMAAYRSPAQNALLVGAAEIERLRAALVAYGKHHEGCDLEGGSPYNCTCGLYQALRPADETTRCPSGLKGYTRCKLAKGHSGDCDYEDLL